MIARALPMLSRKRAGPRIALSPSSWGISDAAGWGHQLDPERVLSEAAAVGEGAIEAGPPGFLPDESQRAKPILKRHHLRVVAGPAQAILHHHDIGGLELAHIDGHASWLAALGAETLVLSAMPPRNAGYAHGIVLSSMGWAHLLHLVGSVQHVCSRHKLRLAVQPRYGSMIQGPADIERLLVGTEAGLCLDIGHLVLVGADPVEVLELAAGRIQHVHLNDIDGKLALQVREYGLDYGDAISKNLFKPLGTGDGAVDRVVETLRRTGYRGWYTLDQDTRLPSAEERPLGAISRSLQHLRTLLA
ncbi:MAG TPA: sugar phosphate isomerase/epimerase [Clostridia bacterium]|nr:sugar phosphate isomerase/epimerase [Clostridia bacterium]